MQPDWDGDGIGDACDDSDFDGVADLAALQSFGGDSGGACLTSSSEQPLLPGIVTPSETTGVTRCESVSVAEIVKTAACDPSCCGKSRACAVSTCDVSAIWSSGCRRECCKPDDSILSVAAFGPRLVYGGVDRLAILDPGAIARVKKDLEVTTTDVVQDKSLGPVWDVQVHGGKLYAATQNGVRRFDIAQNGQIMPGGLLVAGDFVRALIVIDGWIVFGDRAGIAVANLTGIKVASRSILGGVTDLQVIDFDGDGRFDWAHDRLYAVGAGPVTSWRFDAQTHSLLSAPVVDMNPSGAKSATKTASDWKRDEDHGSVAKLRLPRLRAQNTRLYVGAEGVMSWDQVAPSSTAELKKLPHELLPGVHGRVPLLDDAAAFFGTTLSAREGKLWRSE